MTGSPENATVADATPPFRYTPALAGEIELKWQDFWEQHGTFNAPNPVGDLSAGYEIGRAHV